MRIEPEELRGGDRRDWLATAARYAVLGGLGLLAGRLTRCTAAVACTACDRRAACSLPQAVAARQEQRE